MYDGESMAKSSEKMTRTRTKSRSVVGEVPCAHDDQQGGGVVMMVLGRALKDNSRSAQVSEIGDGGNV
jgi:malic enzyme